MNCKPGDVAYVARERMAMMSCQHGHETPILPAGFVVKVDKIALDIVGSNGPVWNLAEPVDRYAVFPCGYRRMLEVLAISDAALRPIGNPPDDAVDEMVRKVGTAPAVDAPKPEPLIAARDHNRSQWP